MEQVLSNSSKVMIDVQGGNNMIYLPLDKMMGGNSSSPATGSTAPNAPQQESQASSVMKSAEQLIQQGHESIRNREKR